MSNGKFKKKSFICFFVTETFAMETLVAERNWWKIGVSKVGSEWHK